MKILFSGLLFWIHLSVSGQIICTAPGQNPQTAFPVCGTSTFTQTSVPLCGGKPVPSPTCNSYPLTDINPFWYKFTCYQPGTLGFNITPNTNSEDYDWQLFDITNHLPTEVYNNVSLSIASNWSGEGGQTGASSAGSQYFVCEGAGKPLWSKMPALIQAHEYLLLVSHFTQTQSGYSINFSGGTAIITDSISPQLFQAKASCSGDIIHVKLNKKVKCNSLTPTGSEFYILPGNLQILKATAVGCATGFDTDSIDLQMTSLLPGTYSLVSRPGSDGNTLLDYCDQPIAVNDKVNFEIYPLVPTPMDSLAPVTCKPNLLRLVFRKPILCSSIAANGSDFQVTGSYQVAIATANGGCSGSAISTNEIFVSLTQPIFKKGTFNITLNKGTDGNTLLDECGKETPAGSFLVFSAMDTVNADFTFKKSYGCTEDTVYFLHPGGNGVNKWFWTLDENKTSLQQSPIVQYQIFNNKKVQLIVSNGTCADTTNQLIRLDNFLKADFTGFEDVCPKEPTVFTSTAQGIGIKHIWDFGDGNTSFLPSPSHTYAAPTSTLPRVVTYSVTDSFGCTSKTQKTIKVYSSCYLAVPSGFTPNHDGLNDYFGPLNAIKAEQLDFRVFNRWGQLLYHTNNWKQGWDGNYKGRPQNTDVYVWILTYVERSSGKQRIMKGTVGLIR